MATKKNKEDRFEQIGSKIDPAMAEVLRQKYNFNKSRKG